MFQKDLHFAFYFLLYIFVFTEKNPQKNSKIFKNITTANKTSLSAYLPISYAILKKKFRTYAPGYILYCQRMAKHAKQSSDATN